MLNNFYQTPEYLNFAKVYARIQQPGGNTYKNMEVYIDRFAKAMEVCERDYNNTGYVVLDRDGCKVPAYKWAPSPELSNPIDYDGSKVVEKSIFGEKVSIHKDGSMTCCKSGFFLDPGSVQQIMNATQSERMKLFDILKVFPGSQIVEKKEEVCRPQMF